MKQVIISVVCIAILVIGGIAEIKYLNKSASYLSYDIEYIRNAINNDNYDIAKEQLNNTINNWEAQKKIWHIFVNNEEIENIDESIVELEEYLNNQMKEESLVEVSKLISLVKYSAEMQKLSLETII
ncbi:MAG: DUF4363 family protein [Clostridia bacterium]|nr:DUF4363 family protein [Clostridia bacterium]